jgi:hypothetical protein
MRSATGKSWISEAIAAGCQKRRKYSPQGVPGPTRVNSSSASAENPTS